MPDQDTIGLIAQEIGLALEPIDTALSSQGAFSAFMRVLGWDTSGYIAGVQNVGSIVTNIINAVENGLDASQAANIISQVVNLFNAVSQLSSASGLPGTIDVTEFQNDFPGQLVDYLIGHYLLNNRANAGSVAARCRRDPQDAEARRRQTASLRSHRHRLGRHWQCAERSPGNLPQCLFLGRTGLRPADLCQQHVHLGPGLGTYGLLSAGRSGVEGATHPRRNRRHQPAGLHAALPAYRQPGERGRSHRRARFLRVAPDSIGRSGNRITALRHRFRNHNDCHLRPAFNPA